MMARHLQLTFKIPELKIMGKTVEPHFFAVEVYLLLCTLTPESHLIMHR
jgi:hypothetical protein